MATTFRQMAAEHGARAAMHLRTLDRAMAIEQQQGAPCLPESERQHLIQQAWANAKLAGHYAGLGSGVVK